MDDAENDEPQLTREIVEQPVYQELEDHTHKHNASPSEEVFRDEIDEVCHSRESSIEPEESSLFFEIGTEMPLPHVQTNADAEIQFRSGNPCHPK